MIIISLDFDKRFEQEIPPEATYGGIYVVYSYNGDEVNPEWWLLDVGQANDIYKRHQGHERKPAWQKFAMEHNSILVLYTAEITNEHNYRDIAEAALLYKFQPICVTDGKNGYHHGDVTISVTGRLEKAFGEFSLSNTGR